MFPVKNVDLWCSLLLCVSLLCRKTLVTYHCSLGFGCWLRVWAFCLLLCILFCSLRYFLRFMSASVCNCVPRYLHSFQVSSSALFILYSSVFWWLIFGSCLFSMSGIGSLYSSASHYHKQQRKISLIVKYECTVLWEWMIIILINSSW